MSRQHRPSLTLAILGRGRRRAAAAFAAASLCLLVAGFIGATASPASAANATVGLGTAADYAVLAGSAVTNTGPSVISGDLGLSPGSAVSGFPPGQVIQGTQHVGDAVALNAQNDLTTAYNDAAGRASSATISADLAGQSLTAGVYTASTTMGLSGTLTLDAQGNPDAVFIFQVGSSLLTASGSRVLLTNGASPCNVFWQVGSSATLGTSTAFVGTIMAMTSATLTTGATLEGRVQARAGAVTLDNNRITASDCKTTPAGTGVGGGSGGAGGSTPTGAATSPSGSSTGPGDSSKTPTPGDNTTTPVIPTGHPSTGVGMAHPSGSTHGHGSSTLFVLAGFAGFAALLAALLASVPATARRH
jgi:hypothetical protein